MNRYTENQMFSQFWLWLILAVIFFYSLYSGTEGFTSTLSISAIIALCIIFLVIMFFTIFRLKLEVSEDGIKYSLFPFSQEKYLNWDVIKSVELIKYEPIKDFGGWGIRYDLNRDIKTYNTGGNVGLLVNGNILIGLKYPIKFKMYLSKNPIIQNKIIIKI
jgi:hypothetical protein